MAQGRKTAADDGQAPPSLPASTANPDVRFELVDEYVADRTSSDPASSIRPAPSRSATRDLGEAAPVYRRVPGGDMVVPTGLVLVRFRDGEVATAHQDDLSSVGFVIEQVLPYAQQAAWVRASGGGVRAALRGLDRLREVPGVVAVEPQMLGARAHRD